MIRDNFLDIWYGNILSDEITAQIYWPLLNKKERVKAKKFTRPELQKKYIKTSGILRKILSTYLDIEPQKISIKTGEYGKPFLADSSVFFNLSHSGNRFVVAVSNCADVGVDMEQYRDRKNLSGLVEKCFSEVERLYWYSLSVEQKTKMFYRFWVRKEAFVKAVGRGIALGLNRCVVNPQSQSCFLKIPTDYGDASNWKILDIHLNEDDICAVVAKNMIFDYTQIELP